MSSAPFKYFLRSLVTLTMLSRLLTSVAGSDSGRSYNLSRASAMATENPGSDRIDLVKRMLEKTRHIRRRNGKAKKGGDGKDDPQTSLTLNPDALQKSTESDGKEAPNQAQSLISKNNFINFCISDLGKVADAVLMDGKQTKKKPACNGIPMGMVPDEDHMPSCKFVEPRNLDKVKANQNIKVTLAVRNLVVGVFTNPAKTFMGAPAQLDPATKTILGHTHIAVQAIDSLSSTVVPDPLAFFFFKGIDDAAKDGKVSVEIKDGLPPGVYRFSTINTAANHQPIGSTVAQHASFDDMIYVTAE